MIVIVGESGVREQFCGEGGLFSSPLIGQVGEPTVLRGESEINLDTKGRLAIPARYREALLSQCAGRLVVTIDIKDKCLFVYPLPEWEKVEAQIAAMPTFNDSTRRLQRLLIGKAKDVEMDGSGRIIIAPALRDYAGIDKKSVLVGQRHRFELWNADNWKNSSDGWLEEAAVDLTLPDVMQTLSI